MLRWRGGVVGRLVAGERMLTPRAEPVAGDFVEGDTREKIRHRLASFARSEIERRLAPLFAISALPLGGVGRGLAFQLADALGALPMGEVAHQVAALDPADRAALSRHGVRFGTETVYVEPLLRPETLRFRALLWAVRNGRGAPALPSARRLAKAIEIDPALPASFYAALGFFVAGGLALRADRLERLAAAARRLARKWPVRCGRPACGARRRRAGCPAAAADGARLSRGHRGRRRKLSSRGRAAAAKRPAAFRGLRRGKAIPLPNCGS